MSWLWGNSIAARVSRVIEQRVASAQKEHDIECKAIDDNAELQKEKHATAMVEKIIGK